MAYGITEYLKERGLTVVRFTNDDVLSRPETVVTAIRDLLIRPETS